MKPKRSIVSRVLARRAATLARMLPPPLAIVGKPGNLRRSLRMLGIVVMIAALAAPSIASAADAARRPNIVIILGDDLGFADMGAFGQRDQDAEPRLAHEGRVRFTNFYTHASCSPTRSVLLSGVDTHLNGLGNMDEWAAPNQWGVDGYEVTSTTGWPRCRSCSRRRLSHLHGRQVAPGQGAGPDSRRRGFERDFSCSTGRAATGT